MKKRIILIILTVLINLTIVAQLRDSTKFDLIGKFEIGHSNFTQTNLLKYSSSYSNIGLLIGYKFSVMRLITGIETYGVTGNSLDMSLNKNVYNEKRFYSIPLIFSTRINAINSKSSKAFTTDNVLGFDVSMGASCNYLLYDTYNYSDTSFTFKPSKVSVGMILSLGVNVPLSNRNKMGIGYLIKSDLTDLKLDAFNSVKNMGTSSFYLNFTFGI